MDSVGKDAKTLKICLKASKIQNINGSIRGKDGKPLLPMRMQFGTNVKGYYLQKDTAIDPMQTQMDDSQPNDGWVDPGINAMKSAEVNNSSPIQSFASYLKATELETDATSLPKKSFASVLHGNNSDRPTTKVNFRKMVNPNVIENSDFELPIAAIKAVQHKYKNSLVGFLVGKKVAFPLVKNYITNTWAKFGFKKIMGDDEWVFYFKFSSLKGLEQVLEQGPWLIRNVPLILTKWSPNMTLSKDEVTRVPVWVKMHKVLVVAYSADGLSLIAS
ncbi:retrovirus-related pol polyprotein from transposon TNT 1-94 [Tanacetum coccineum]